MLELDQGAAAAAEHNHRHTVQFHTISLFQAGFGVQHRDDVSSRRIMLCKAYRSSCAAKKKKENNKEMNRT